MPNGSQHDALLSPARKASCKGAAELVCKSWLTGRHCQAPDTAAPSGHSRQYMHLVLQGSQLLWYAEDGCKCGSPVSLVERRRLRALLTSRSTSVAACADWVQWLPDIIPILLLHNMN